DKVDQNKKEYYKFFIKTAKLILAFCSLEKGLSPTYFKTKSFDELSTTNQELYMEILPDNYKISYTNPSYAVEIFGESFGQLMSYFYCEYRRYIRYAYTHMIYKMEEYNQVFIEVYNFINNNKLDYEKIKEIVVAPQFTTSSRDNYIAYKTRYDTEYRFFTDLIEYADFTDLRYLYRTGYYISDNEKKIAQFLQQYPDEKITILAKEAVGAYFKGFERDNKDVRKKSTLGLYYQIGLEKIYREIVKEFRARNLECTVISVHSTDVNKQFNYDHKFDQSLYLNKEYTIRLINRFTEGLEKNEEILGEFSGVFAIENFGEKLFSPKIKKANLKFTDEQKKLFLKLNNDFTQIYDKYAPETETSYCIISFPTPEIGDKFKEIFEDTMEINMLNSDKYEKIQQHLIDVLDQADSVHIKGKEGNETDITVKLHKLETPEKETLFVNCGAAVNIPVGEVYTSPQLIGTNGILHVKETYLQNFRYDNLKLVFKDGYIETYSCTNFEKEEENKKYIEENLLMPHKTLPIGEFAIGTNTLAYVVSRKYGIMRLLPVLILEKTGPHIAIGDTCFSRSEDLKQYNHINHKLVVATDNEKSILRKTTIEEAYTNKHVDITLPFDDLEYITAVKGNDERINIIKDGRFILEGTQELNKPLDQMIKEYS
ncbi:MAG: aminopeptidase, partial [Promethearchaeota archaeon]